MDVKGVKDFSDVARSRRVWHSMPARRMPLRSRGISSSGGSGTTGIYIDDVPIQGA